MTRINWINAAHSSPSLASQLLQGVRVLIPQPGRPVQHLLGEQHKPRIESDYRLLIHPGAEQQQREQPNPYGLPANTGRLDDQATT